MRPRSWAINAFILGYLVAVVSWSLPLPAWVPAVRAFRRLSEPLILRSGLWHGWDMFAPTPLALNVSVDARVRLADGSEVTWVFPRMERLGYLERYRKERYRKWRERVRLDAYAFIWPDTARWIARQVSRPGLPAQEVVLTRRWAAIPPPAGPWLPPRLRDPVLTEQFDFFTYAVLPGDLS